MRCNYFFFAILAIFIILFLFQSKIQQIFSPLTNKISGKATIAERIEQYGSQARKRLEPYFEKTGVDYPPAKLILVGLKQEKVLEVWARKNKTKFNKIKEYSILGSSGVLGPKLKEGDMQVPEGIYRIESLNPNSRFHLALRLNYPNEFDIKYAKAEGRKHPGGDIMIHGSSVSIGCLAMGNEAIEDLFVLANDTGIENIKVILSPVDFRKTKLPQIDNTVPEWTDELYSSIRRELEQLQP